jgi:hypothetical protein
MEPANECMTLPRRLSSDVRACRYHTAWERQQATSVLRLERPNSLGVVRLTKDSGAGDKNIGTSLVDVSGIVGFHVPVHFDHDTQMA